MNSGPPEHDVRIPNAVHTLIAGNGFEAVWENELGGLTFAVETDTGEREFIKWTPTSAGIDLVREIVRLRWAGLWLAVPRVLDHGQDAEGAWLITAAVPGESAVSPRWTNDPKTAVTAIGSGLRFLHDTLPVQQCPFTWSNESRIATARRRAAQGDTDPANWDGEHKHLTVHEALDLVDAAPSIDRLVVCHGDACAEHTARRRRRVQWSRRSRFPRRRRQVGRPRDRDLEHDLELRTGMGATAAHRVRRRSRPGAQRVLSAALGSRPVTRIVR